MNQNLKIKNKDEINKLANIIVQEVVKAAKQKVLKDEEELIKKTAIKLVNNAIREAKTKAEREKIKQSAFNLVNQVIKEVCDEDGIDTRSIRGLNV